MQTVNRSKQYNHIPPNPKATASSAGKLAFAKMIPGGSLFLQHIIENNDRFKNVDTYKKPKGRNCYTKMCSNIQNILSSDDKKTEALNYIKQLRDKSPWLKTQSSLHQSNSQIYNLEHSSRPGHTGAGNNDNEGKHSHHRRVLSQYDWDNSRVNKERCGSGGGNNNNNNTYVNNYVKMKLGSEPWRKRGAEEQGAFKWEGDKVASECTKKSECEAKNYNVNGRKGERVVSRNERTFGATLMINTQEGFNCQNKANCDGTPMRSGARKSKHNCDFYGSGLPLPLPGAMGDAAMHTDKHKVRSVVWNNEDEECGEGEHAGGKGKKFNLVIVQGLRVTLGKERTETQTKQPKQPMQTKQMKWNHFQIEVTGTQSHKEQPKRKEHFDWTIIASGWKGGMKKEITATAKQHETTTGRHPQQKKENDEKKVHFELIIPSKNKNHHSKHREDPKQKEHFELLISRKPKLKHDAGVNTDRPVNEISKIPLTISVVRSPKHVQEMGTNTTNAQETSSAKVQNTFYEWSKSKNESKVHNSQLIQMNTINNNNITIINPIPKKKPDIGLPPPFTVPLNSIPHSSARKDKSDFNIHTADSGLKPRCFAIFEKKPTTNVKRAKPTFASFNEENYRSDAIEKEEKGKIDQAIKKYSDMRLKWRTKKSKE